MLESREVPRSPNWPSADRLLLSPTVVAVVDGATAKPWHSSSVGLDGGAVAQALVDTLASLDPQLNLETGVKEMSAVVSRGASVADASALTCATFAAVNLERREVWRVGDPWVMIDGELHQPHRGPEEEVASHRADVLRLALARGVPVSKLRADDPGRASIIGRLRDLDTRRNDASGNGLGAVDGRPVPSAHLEVWRLPEEASEVVLATDGYPRLGIDLADSERLLAERLSRDPLLIEAPAQTKSHQPGSNSYDDRTYVRVRVPALGDTSDG